MLTLHKKNKQYKPQDRYQFQKLPINVENKAGSYRTGYDEDGKPWKTKMTYDYGEIRGTEGVDGDAVDAFINRKSKGKRVNPHPEAGEPLIIDTDVYVVAQKQLHKTRDHHNGRCPDCGKHNSECYHNYDEDKVMLGFESKDEAVKAYLENYDSPRVLGPVSTYTINEFREELKRSSKKKIPDKKPVMVHWTGVDLDGTLAKWNGWKGVEHIGEPIERTKQMILKLLAAGKKVKIFTARAHDPKAIPYIKEWLKHKGIPDLEITNKKDPGMIALYDDRAIRVEKNTGKIIKAVTGYYLDLDKSYLGESGDPFGSSAFLRENIIRNNPKAVIMQSLQKEKKVYVNPADEKVTTKPRLITEGELRNITDELYRKKKKEGETKQEFINRYLNDLLAD